MDETGTFLDRHVVREHDVTGVDVLGQRRVREGTFVVHARQGATGERRARRDAGAEDRLDSSAATTTPSTSA